MYLGEPPGYSKTDPLYTGDYMGDNGGANLSPIRTDYAPVIINPGPAQNNQNGLLIVALLALLLLED